MSKHMDFYHSQEIVLTNVEKKLLDTATKTELDAAKAASKKKSIKQLKQQDN